MSQAPSQSPAPLTRITVSGPDTPGITAAMSAVLATASVPLVDLEHVVVHGQLTLCLHVQLPDDTAEALSAELRAAAGRMGLTFEQTQVAPHPAPPPTTRVAITALADPIEARHLQRLAETLAQHEANITAIERLDEGTAPISALEVRAELRSPPTGDAHDRLRHALLQLALKEGVDLAVQREGLARRSKRLVVMDMDSTLIRVEVIDELARAHGVFDQVRGLTATAMAGDLDYAESLRRRVALLEGLPIETVHRIADDLPFTEGVEDLVRVLKRLGYRTAVISGGFAIAASRVQRRLGLDHAHSNRLEVADGRLTGRVVPPVVTPERKADLLRTIASVEGIPIDQTIAIGDGANDLDMIEAAGLGVAFQAKTRLREAADTALSAGGLDRVLYLLGLRQRDTRELLAEPVSGG